jgi:uncharacterized protein YbjT (DUF2867 family)
MASVLISGATGFVGRNLAAALLSRGHQVCALVRAGSESRAPAGCRIAIGDPLDSACYRGLLSEVDTLVHLVGVSHPSPAKAAMFRQVDLPAAKIAVEAARVAAVRHFMYVSVAHPAPVMKEYIAVRSHVEELIRAAGMNATILRPWYVLGPGRRWPLLLAPLYWLGGALPATRDSARRLGLVTLSQMVQTMALAVERPPEGIRILEVPEIRQIINHKGENNGDSDDGRFTGKAGRRGESPY